MSTRIILVDSERLLIESLRVVIDREPDLEIVGLGDDGRLALSLVEQLSPDVVVMAVAMAELNGIEATVQICDRFPNTKVIALSACTDSKFVRGMLEAGAYGYVTKEAAATELLRAIRRVQSGQKFLSTGVTGTVVEGYINPEVEDNSAMAVLSGREREVLQLIAEGFTSGEVAAKLTISTATVDTHRRNIMKKLCIHSVAELTKYAIREGLTDLQA